MKSAAAARLAGIILLLPLLAACAAVPTDPAARAAFLENNDRLEPLNRAMFRFDQTTDRILIHPIISGYHAVVPDPARKSLLTFKRNISEPVTLVHNVLQGNLSAAGRTFGRFALNTTVGFFGFFDVAEKAGMTFRSEDFGQTLAVWGVGDGSYLYIPFLGPSSIRDGFGYGVDAFFVDPVSWYSYNPHNMQWVQWAELGLIYVTEKDDNMQALDELKKSSIDYYAALRSAYRQIRASEIRNGAPPPLEDLDAPE